MVSALQAHLKQSLADLIRSHFKLPYDRVTVNQAAQLISLHEMTVRRAISLHEFPIPSHKEDGRRYLFLTDVVDHLVSKAIPACLVGGAK